MVVIVSALVLAVVVTVVVVFVVVAVAVVIVVAVAAVIVLIATLVSVVARCTRYWEVACTLKSSYSLLPQGYERRNAFCKIA